MTSVIPRTCTRIRQDSDGEFTSAQSRGFCSFRDSPAIVLLGDPGMGKTTAFRSEVKALDGAGEFFTARDFLTIDLQNRADLDQKTLFIDGLDEVRAGSGDPRNRLDQIRYRLERLGNPRFRISCRPSSWISKSDRTHLARVSPDSELVVLSLDPLTDEESEAILELRGVDEPNRFIFEARSRQLQGLLANPQSLDLLVKTVDANGMWPNGRVDLFDQACRLLARERNQEHEIASRRPAIEQLLDAAGYLCAVLLTTGNAGMSINSHDPTAGYVPLQDCTIKPAEVLESALATRIFQAVGEGEFEPVHRHIAEFLGGCYFARLVDEGHPVKRVLALITGIDGGVISSLRGLSAWIATLCRPARAKLIELDPAGVGQYGDIADYSPSEKRELLEFLRRDFASLYSIWSGRGAFLPLASSDMQAHIAALLTDEHPDLAGARVAEFVLSLISEKPRLAQLDELLLVVAADERWSGYARQMALSAYIRNCPDSASKSQCLNGLLQRVSRSEISDPGDELRGTLLECLYPDSVGPEQIWDHLVPGPAVVIGGPYWRFWQEGLIRLSGPAQVSALLDHLHDQADLLLRRAESRGFWTMQICLLNRGLQLCGDEIEPAQLHRWLSTGHRSRQPRSVDEEELAQIRDWIEARPQLQLDASLECLRTLDAGDFSHDDFHVFRECMFGALIPEGFAAWALSNIEKIADSSPQSARRLISALIDYRTEFQGESGAWKDELLAAVSGHPDLLEFAEKLVNLRMNQQSHRSIRSQENPATLNPEMGNWLDALREHIEELRGNCAPPALLHDLGRAAFGLLWGQSRKGTAAQRLSRCFNGDSELLDAALIALRGAPFRSDVPTVADTLGLIARSRHSMLNYAVLAGLDELARCDQAKLAELSDDQIRNAVAISFCTPIGGVGDLQWFDDWINSRTDLVADVMADHAVAQFHAKSEYVESIHRLAYDRRYQELARRITLQLLESFPIRCNLRQLRVLDHLLISALTHCDQQALASLIAKKVAYKSMLPAPLAHWLAAGVVIDPGSYAQQLASHVSGKHPHIKQLVRFLEPRRAYPRLRRRISPDATRVLIGLIGSEFGPRWEDGWVGPEANASDLLRDMFADLSSNSTEDAARVLGELVAQPALSAWRAQLEYARAEQLVLRRDSLHRFPTAKDADASLTNGPPANPADLAALVDDHICDLASRIHTGDTNDWHQYWNEPRGEDPTPKHEEQCRDSLLSDLRTLLPSRAHAEPEGRYTNGNRSDIKVLFGPYHVPVEVKKQSHPGLWTAIRDQLRSKYTSDPVTGGYGIYLVLWFGPEISIPAGPEEAKPASANDLRRQLVDTLTDEELRKISVRVVDVSRPIKKK